MNSKLFLRFLGMASFASIASINQAKAVSPDLVHHVSFQDMHDGQTVERMKKSRAIVRREVNKENIRVVYSEVVSMSNIDRNAIAELIRTDFKAFMESRFLLTAEQLKCLDTNWKDDSSYQGFLHELSLQISRNAKLGVLDIDDEVIDAPAARKDKVDKEVHAKYSKKNGLEVGIKFKF